MIKRKLSRIPVVASGVRTAAILCLAIIFALTPVTGCKFLEMKPLSVVRVTPDGEVIDRAGLTRIEVEFSADVDQSLTSRAFSLLEDGEVMQGIVSWPAGDRLLFIPYSDFKDASTYTISVTTQAEDTDGNSLEDDFTRKFRFSADATRPAVIAISPAANASIGSVRPAVSITFSEPMDLTSVIDGFDLAPAAEGFFRSTADHTTFEYVLTEDLDWQTRYEIVIANSAKDLAGNTLGKETKSAFFTGLESTNPTIVSVVDMDASIPIPADSLSDAEETVADGVNAKDRIIVRFSEPMDRESVTNGIVLTPTTRYESSWNADGTELTITPDPAFDYGKTICLTVSKASRDLSGNEMIEAASFKFRVTGTRSRPPVVVGVDFLNGFDPSTGSPLSTGLIELTPMASFAFADKYTPESTPATVPIGFIDIHFELAEGATLNLIEFLSKFSISADGASITPFAAEIDSNITHMTTVPYDRGLPASPTRHVVRYYAYVNNYAAAYKFVPGLLKLSLPSDFADSAGNALGSAWSLTVNTTN